MQPPHLKSDTTPSGHAVVAAITGTLYTGWTGTMGVTNDPDLGNVIANPTAAPIGAGSVDAMTYVSPLCHVKLSNLSLPPTASEHGADWVELNAPFFRRTAMLLFSASHAPLGTTLHSVSGWGKDAG